MKKPLLALAAALLATGAAQADTLSKIKETGKVVMGVRDSSGVLSYTLGNGKYAGFHVNLCEVILNNIRKEQKLSQMTVEYIPVTSQNRIPLVQNGTVDIECGSTTNNQARQQQVAFALTTFVTEVRMAVRANSGSLQLRDVPGHGCVFTIDLPRERPPHAAIFHARPGVRSVPIDESGIGAAQRAHD